MTKSLWGRTVAVVTVVAVLLASCGGDGGGRGGDATSVGTGSAEAGGDAGGDGELAQVVEEAARKFAALDPQEQAEAAAAGARELWLALLELSGLSDELGAEEAERLSEELFASIDTGDLDALLADMGPAEPGAGPGGDEESVGVSPLGDTGVVLAPVAFGGGRVRPVPANTPPGGSGSGGGSGDAGAVSGLGLFLGFMEVGLLTRFTAGLGKDGEAGSGTRGDFTGSGDRRGARVEANHDTELGPARLQVRNRVEIQACPDADGSFVLKVRLDFTMSAGTSGGRAEIDVVAAGRLNDDAQIDTVTHEVRVQMGDYEQGKTGQFFDVTLTSDLPGGKLAAATNTKWVTNRTSSKVNPERASKLAEAGSLAAAFLTQEMLKSAAEQWESGRCVTLEPTSDPAQRTGLAPRATVTITAAPRSLLDGTPTGGNVTATLSGGTSVTPNGTKVPADATFTYVAPDEENQTATVALEARSRRGVAKAQVEFRTRRGGYVASGGGEGLEVSGRVDSVEETFVITGTFPGGEAVITYSPTGPRAGSYVAELAGSGVTGTVTGTYTITEGADGVLTLTAQGYGCVQGIPGSCRSTSEVITLTPAG